MHTVSIAGHNLTSFELEVLTEIQRYMRKNAGDSGWSPTTSPRGDGRGVLLSEIFTDRLTVRKQAANRLARFGVLRACEIEYKADRFRGVPLRVLHSRERSESQPAKDNPEER